MDSSLLATKVRIPPPSHRALYRTRLINTLERGIPNYKLILCSAPAGYGKSTLLSQWADSSQYQVAWLSVDEADDDVGRFFRCLLRAWGTIQPDVMESSLAILLGDISPDMETILTEFINVAADLSEHIVLVLDDFHLIKEPSIHKALIFLLDYLPPMIHFILAGRGEPPLPLARYRAQGDLLEIRAYELRFLPEETQEFLREKMRLDLAPEKIEPLQAQTEGWIAGLQLAAMTLQKGLTDLDKVVISGRHRFIADYLGEEVLASVPDGMQRFLLQTSILDRLCGPLCEAVTRKENGQQMLEALEREGLFLLPLDDRREWFRYHHLFTDFLREELKKRHPNQAPELHRRAANWHLAQDLPEQAFYHAAQTDDVELVHRILERYLQPKLLGGEFRLVKRWLDSLPETWHTEYPMIGLARAGFLLFTGQIDACVRWVEKIETQLASTGSENTRPLLARVKAVQCSIACFQDDLGQAETFADRALQEMPEEDHLFRAILLGSLGDTYRRHGRWQKAKKCYLELVEFIHEPALRLQSAHVYGALADLDLRQGHLQKAADNWRKALAVIQEWEHWGHLPLPLVGWVYIRMAEILYEWNELGEAWAHLSQGLERAELGGDVRAMIAGYLIAGRLKLTQGDAETAAGYLEKARPLVEQAHFSHWISRFERLQLELWLAQDRLRAAVNWSDKMLKEQSLKKRPESEEAQLAMARVLIFKGDRPAVQRALTLLETLLETAEAEGMMDVTIEAWALLALAHKKRGETVSAMTSLESALRAAEPEGYVRRFVDLGLPLAFLLQEALSRDVMPEYVEMLLAAFDSDADSMPSPEKHALPEPLTDREGEVLELIAAGLTNREIAEELVISPETVKKHAGNIYGKLGVGGRTEAAARARELDILK